MTFLAVLIHAPPCFSVKKLQGKSIRENSPKVQLLGSSILIIPGVSIQISHLPVFVTRWYNSFSQAIFIPMVAPFFEQPGLVGGVPAYNNLKGPFQAKALLGCWLALLLARLLCSLIPVRLL